MSSASASSSTRAHGNARAPQVSSSTPPSTPAAAIAPFQATTFIDSATSAPSPAVSASAVCSKVAAPPKVVLIFWVLAKVPDYPGQPARQALPMLRVLATPGVRSVLGTVMAWMLAHNILYTYIAPFLDTAGLPGRVDLVLLVFGVAALVSIWITARLVDRHLRAAVLVSLAVFGAVALLFALGFEMLAATPAILYAGVVVWGLTFGGAATLLQTALADTAGDGADVALSMNVVAWNGAIAAAGVLGGVLLETWGARAFPWALVVLLALALVIVRSARRHGFPAGARTGGAAVAGH